jgi:tetratricopeptide (TPR) repeat protein
MHRNHRGWLEMQGASSLIKLGRWDEAMETLDGALARGPSGITRRGVQLMRAQLQVARGDVEGATASAADAQRAVEGDQPFTGRMFHVMASLALERGEYDAAEQLVSRGLAVLEPLDDVQAAVRLRLRGLQAQAERPDPSVAIAEQLLAEVRAVTALDLPVAGAELPALRASCEAEFGRAIGSSDPATWSAAAEAWGALGQPYPQAYSLMRAAQAAGRPDAEALRLARQLGTPRLIEALQALG